jgi:hypothetical protein
MRVTDQATRVVSAGWYQDPASSVQVRWWNGVAWTEHVREKPTASPITETTEQRIAAVRDLEHQFDIGAVDDPGVNGRASTPAAATAAATKRAAAHASTAAAWMIALSPLLAFVLGLVATYLYLYLVPNPVVFVIAVGLPYLLCVLWALGDGRTLRDRGFTPPSAVFALLTGLGYLIVRRTRIPGSGPIAMFLVVAVLAFGSLPAAAMLGQTRGLTNALNIQRTISADYISNGKAVSVNCPPFVDATTVGTLYTCDATMATGVHRTIWVSIDSADGKFSYSFGL